MTKTQLSQTFVEQLAKNSKTIGSFIGSLTSLNGFTRTEFTNLMSISLSYASQLLCDRVNWTPELVRKAADVFSIDESVFSIIDPDILKEAPEVIEIEDKKLTQDEKDFGAVAIKTQKVIKEKPEAEKKPFKQKVSSDKEINLTDFTPVEFNRVANNRLPEYIFTVNTARGTLSFSTSFGLKDYNYISILENKEHVCALCFTKKATATSFKVSHDKYKAGRISSKTITNYLKDRYKLGEKARFVMGPNLAKNVEAVIRVIEEVQQ